MFKATEVLEKYPDILEYFSTYRRLYEIQEKFDLSRVEVQILTNILTKEEYLKNTPLGWKAVE